ncbi:MAG: 2-oxoacid:acceptor oxidoreductase family protein [Desulfobacterales bacterium]|jgi:indolepyruvate ferredoxin oxidoreductase beta subunit|nr:2-oxoacid:acceptor oxidoreductase family protein [Desulfobacterales bacterium]
MASPVRQQLLISGVGGQGVLFVTRLLAEAAIAKGLPVFTCETHGMAQRGGTVVSHLKVGDYHSPLVRAGQADGLLVLKSENLAQHGAFMKSGGWAVVNAGPEETCDVRGTVFAIEADRLAQATGNVKSLNLVVLGYALSVAGKMKGKAGRLFCTLADIERTIKKSFKAKPEQLSVFLNAIRTGYHVKPPSWP